MRRLPYIVFLICTIAACTGNRVTETLLQKADSLMDISPDSVYRLLDSLCDRSEGYSRSLRMRCELLKAKAQNKAYVDFTTDSVMLQVADYYDSHGTPNERMLAHYLLGCAYRDLKEAPMSLQCYYDAVESADTTSVDCDYRTMMSIYGQIADLLDKQCMPYEEIASLNECRKCAWKIGETCSSIQCIELMVRPYMLLGDSDNVIRYAEKARKAYLEHGMTDKAAQTYYMPIDIYLGRHEYAKAQEAMQILESESGDFDAEGNIRQGAESYYYDKGQLFEGLNQLDSAEYYYRKLRDYGFDYYALTGLIHLYGKYHNIDSLLYYSRQQEEAYNSMTTAYHTQAMHQVEGMYDYQRNKSIAEKKELEAVHARMESYFITAICIIAFAIFCYIYFRYRRRKTKEISMLNDNYRLAVDRLENVTDELMLSEQQHEEFHKRKQQEIDLLKADISKYRKYYLQLESTDNDERLQNNAVVRKFMNMTQQISNHQPTESEWKDLVYVIRQEIPLFYMRVMKSTALSEQEKYICILSRLEFHSSDMAYLLGTSPQNISNARNSINNKLFSEKTARTLINNLKTIDSIEK